MADVVVGVKAGVADIVVGVLVAPGIILLNKLEVVGSDAAFDGEKVAGGLGLATDPNKLLGVEAGFGCCIIPKVDAGAGSCLDFLF